MNSVRFYACVYCVYVCISREKVRIRRNYELKEFELNGTDCISVCLTYGITEVSYVTLAASFYLLYLMFQLRDTKQ